MAEAPPPVNEAPAPARRSTRSRRKEGIRRRTPPGAAPGTVAVDPEAPRPRLRVMSFGPDQVVEDDCPKTLDFLRERLASWPVTWVNVDGLGDAQTIQELGEIFGLHRLALEDVVNVHQRAKAELYDRHYFVVARMADPERSGTEQLSLFIGGNYVLTFQERPGDCFDPVRERIRKGGGQLRRSGADYLAYALLDAFIDSYFPFLERYGEQLEQLEDEAIQRPDKSLIAGIHNVKRELLVLRRAVWPLREAISTLIRETTPLITPETRVYLRDCYDHSIQIIDLLENYRDVASSLMEVYLSSVSNRLNEIMKVLTMFTTLFIPLTFISSIYGMNFQYMPEIPWRYGYVFVWIVMIATAGGMLIYFRRKGWFGGDSSPRRRPKRARDE